MRIIFGATSFDHDKQAKQTIKARNDHAKKHGSMPLVGIAEHTAMWPHVCDDCSETFWDTDEYGRCHVGCRGTLKKAGF